MMAHTGFPCQHPGWPPLLPAAPPEVARSISIGHPLGGYSPWRAAITGSSHIRSLDLSAVTTSARLRSRRPIRPGEQGAGIRGARMLAAAALALLMVGGASAAARAETAPPPSLAPTPFAITSPTFSPGNDVTIAGTMAAGSSVTVTAGSGECEASPADSADTQWNCALRLPNGAGQVVTATETLEDGSAGGQATQTLAVLGPPKVDPSPAQQAPGVARGTGYPGSIITLLVNSATQSCSAPVAASGAWLCTIAGGAGSYLVQATQRVSSMGTSNPSNQQTILVNPAPPVVTPDPVIPPPVPQPAPVLPAPAPPVVADEPESTPTPTPTPSERADAGTLPWLERPIFPGSSGDGTTIGEALTNWGTPTGFGSKLPTPGETVTGANWAWAPLFALAFIALLAMPLRLLAEVLRGRLPQRSPQLAGRNRIGEPAEEPVPRNPWLMGAVPLAVTAALIALAEGLNGEVRYVRLLFAVGAGLAILNVIGVAIATRLSSQRLGVSGRLRFLPILLVIAAIATLIARVTGMEPPLVGGVLIATTFAMGMPARPRAVVSLSQVGGVLMLALLAWVAHSLIGPVDGFWASVLVETLATVCLAGIGSALILMLPIGALPGRVVFEWSRGAWFGATALVATVTAAILIGGVQATFPTLAVLLTVAGFAAVSIAAWTWTNYARVSGASSLRR